MMCFMRPARISFSFRWLPMKVMEVLIDDAYQFLFKSARIRQAEHILSYASNPPPPPPPMMIYTERNITKSGVRSLLHGMANLMTTYRGHQPSEQFQAIAGENDEQMPRNLGPNITMKRGDWICPKCNFMNFARNTKCLECEELRPQRQLIGGEWDCPRCNFFNYQKNVVCLKCECKRPDEAPLRSDFRVTNKNPVASSFDHNQHQFHGNTSRTYAKSTDTTTVRNNSGYVPFVPLQPSDVFAKKPENTTNEHSHEVSATYVPSRQIQDTDKEDKTERWFKKVKELHGVSSPTSAISHNDFPRFIPERKEENHFVDNKKKDQPDYPYKTQQADPFPPNYFSKKDEICSENSNNASIDTNTDSSSNQFRRNEAKPESSPVGQRVGQQTPENMNVRNGWTGKSLEGSAVTEPDPLDMSEEAKAERWFKRVAQIKDISELSQIPDEDFPSIMPMRKGVNRFVVSKRKTPLERRLTSPQYRKNLRIMSSDPMKKEGNDDD